MSYLHIPRTKVSQWRKPEYCLDAALVPSEGLIRWCDDTICRWMRHFDVPEKLWADGKLRWTFTTFPTRSPAAFATYWPGYIHLMVFDTCWWNLMSDEQRQEIFLHELAHVIERMTKPDASSWVAKVYGWFDLTKGHNKRWARIMKDMSLPPDRYLKHSHKDDKRSLEYSLFTGLSVNDDNVVANFRVGSFTDLSTHLLHIAVGMFGGSVLGTLLGLLWSFV